LSLDLGLLPNRKPEEELGVPAAYPSELRAFFEALAGVFANRLQHLEPVLALLDEALFDQGRKGVEVCVADLLGCEEREPSDENGEPGEEQLLVLVEQLVAPGDGVAERALAVGQVARASGEDGKSLA
jgi:hypothetical protein